MSEPLIEQEYQSLIIRSFAQGKLKPLDLNGFQDKIDKSWKSIASLRKEHPDKVHIRWITDNAENRFSFISKNELNPQKLKRN